MTNTSNYGFNLPAGTDPASITPLNQNFTMIDTYLKAELNLMAADYDSTETYNTGDIVAHDNALYQCNDDGVTGTWDSTKWDAVMLSEVSGGGSDVVVNPTGTQDEVLDGIEVDGVNYGLDVVGEISDVAIASFSDGANLPINKCIVDITAVQSGSGDPSPSNIRPISGWSEANLWVQTTVDPTADPTATADFNTTIYGGSADLINGSGTKWQYYELDNFTFSEASDYYWIVNNSIPFTQSREIGDCSHFAVGETKDMWVGTGTNTGHYILFVKAKINEYLGISSVAEFNTWLQSQKTNGTPVQLIYPLATPPTFTFTPIPTTNTLEGVNNIYADCGDINELGYFKDGKLTRSVKAIVEAMTGNVNTILADAIGEE